MTITSFSSDSSSDSLPPVDAPESTSDSTSDSTDIFSTPRSLKALVTLLGALDSPVRLQMVNLLSKKDYFVHELVTALNKSQPLISQHLRVLKQANVVKHKRLGRQVAYGLRTPEILEFLQSAHEVAVKIEER